MHELHIPPGISLDRIMHMLKVGHGYSWQILFKHPLLLSHGTPPPGPMPEVLVVGPDRLIFEDPTDSSLERFQRLIDLFSRQPVLVIEGDLE
ncbi:MAG: hypothetical protein K9W43_04560 [Candidatus Thorarchaeota archaeon]|nr:hypothetical protein [Candidatus Thorarchaeota archaeon]